MDGKKNTFAGKHPKIYAFIGLILLIVIIAAIILLANFIFTNIIDGITFLVESLSNYDVVVIVTIITAGVSLISVILSSIVSKLIEYRQSRMSYLSQKREAPYGEFVDMIYKIQTSIKKKSSYTQEEMLKDISSFSKQITLWGSPKVVNKWYEYRDSAIMQNNTNNLFLLEQIMNEMRKDLGLRKTRKGRLLGFFINDIKDVMKKVGK